jgi:hypothetical protein
MAHAASSPTDEDDSFLCYKSCEERSQVVFINDPDKDFKIVCGKNVQSVGGLHLASRNSNSPQINSQQEAHKLQFPSVCQEVVYKTVALHAVGMSALS